MKPASRLHAFTLALAALALTTTATLAAVGDPISAIPIGLEGDPGSIVVAKGVTDEKGRVDFGDLKPGRYTIVIAADALNLALKKLDPKGLRHTIVVTFGLKGEKPMATSSQPYNFPVAASLAVRVAVGDVNGDGDASKTKPHDYVIVVSFAR